MAKGWTSENIKLAIDIFESGKTFTYIAKILGKSYSSVKNYFNRRGLRTGTCAIKYITCLECGGEFKKNEKNDGKYIARRVKFCSNSCSASYSNKNGKRKKKNRGDCLNCGNIITGDGKHYCCQKCMVIHKDNILIDKIKNNDCIELSASRVKRGLIIIYGEKCMKCGWNEINEKSGKVPIEMNHKDGNSENNSHENVELICPNCHSLTPNYKALNYGNGREKRRQRAREGKSY